MFTKKILTLFVIALFTLIYGVSEVNAQALKIGSVVNLHNQYPVEGGYLDTRGRVKDKPEFQRLVPSETLFVSTHPSPSRDKGSGSWKIVSATGKPDGSPLLYGDKFHLMNMYPGAGYLDGCGWVKDLPMYKGIKGKFAVFTTQSKDRDNGTGIWLARVTNSSKKDGDSVMEGDNINLENGFDKFGKVFLDVEARVLQNPSFKEYAGQSLLVFLSESSNRFKNSGVWKITTSEVFGKSTANVDSACSKTISQNPVKINWVNKTGSVMVVSWIDYDCNEKAGIEVNPGEAYQGTSYAGHVFRIVKGPQSDDPGSELITVSPSTASKNINWSR